MAKDPPIGRWGFVVENAFGEGRTADGLGESCCIGKDGCHQWYPEHLHRCPFCDNPKPGFNKHIRTSQLNRHLGGYAHTANRQPTMTPNITSDVSA